MLSSLLLLTTIAPTGEIQHAYDQWTSAYMRMDVDGLDRLVSPDFVWIADDGRKRDRIDFLGGIMRGFGVGQTVIHFTVHIEKLTATKDGWLATITERAQVGNGKFGQVTEDGWRKTADGWQVTSTRLIKRLK